MKDSEDSASLIYHSVNAVCIALLGFMILLTTVYPSRIPDDRNLLSSLAKITANFVILAISLPHLRWRAASTLIYSFCVLILFQVLFDLVNGLQHVFVQQWLDCSLVSEEHRLFGVNVSVLCQRITTPILTEGFMFSYVSYVPLLPLVGVVCFVSAGEKGILDFVLNLALAFSLCFVGFMIVPLASPLYYSPELYGKPLSGGFFTSCGEWIRIHAQYPGGSLPSPHCAGTTVMIAMLNRYNKKVLWLFLPTLVMIYGATVYGRFHYMWDGIAGIVVALGSIKASLGITRLLAAFRSRKSRRYSELEVPAIPASQWINSETIQ